MARQSNKSLRAQRKRKSPADYRDEQRAHREEKIARQRAQESTFLVGDDDDFYDEEED